MMVARHFRRRLLVLSVATLGFFISSFSAVLASDFSGKVVGIIDGDTIEVLHNQRPERDTMTLEEATISNMWEIAAVAGVLDGRATIRHGKTIVSRDRLTSLFNS